MQNSTMMIWIVATLHVGFFILESVLWTSPQVRRIFGTTQADTDTTQVLALNQGFYNLGTAVLLLHFHSTGNKSAVMGLLLFVASMGAVGALTANWRIILLQSAPALVAWVLVYSN